jgi:hypothetical protein
LFGKACIFKASTWIWLSKVNGPVLPKERWIKLLLKKHGSEKKLLTTGHHPRQTARYSIGPGKKTHKIGARTKKGAEHYTI